MIAFASPVTDPEIYERCAAPGLRLAAEPDSEVVPIASAGSIFRNYNIALDRFVDRDDLEAVVLLHQDAEIADRDFCEKIRAALADPEAAIVGCAGGIGQQSIAWWEGAVYWASFTHRYDNFGGGEIPAMSWRANEKRGENPSYERPGEVDAIDGVLIAMSPWAARELRFDESLGELHGYDFDICCQARARGKKVITADIQLVHHHSIKLISNLSGWVEAYIKLAEKWNGQRDSDAGCDWRARALRAEAEASAARLLGGMADLVRIAQSDHDAEHARALERELAEMRASASWRATAPARAIGRRLRGAGR